MSLAEYKLYVQALVLFILVRYKYLDNQVFGTYTKRYKTYAIKELYRLRDKERFRFRSKP